MLLAEQRKPEQTLEGKVKCHVMRSADASAIAMLVVLISHLVYLPRFH